MVHIHLKHVRGMKEMIRTGFTHQTADADSLNRDTVEKTMVGGKGSEFVILEKSVALQAANLLEELQSRIEEPPAVDIEPPFTEGAPV